MDHDPRATSNLRVGRLTNKRTSGTLNGSMLMLDYSLLKEDLSRQVSMSIGFGPFEMLGQSVQAPKKTFSTDNHE